MKLSTKFTLWPIAALFIILINSFFTVYSVLELRTTDQLTAEDYEVDLTIRKIRNGIVEFYTFGLVAGQNDAASKIQQNFSKSKQQLILFLEEKHSKIHSIELSKGIEAAKQKAQYLLSFQPGKDPRSNTISLLNPTFRSTFETVLSELDSLADQSARTVSIDRARNELLVNRFLYLAFSMCLIAIIFSVVIIILLRRGVLLPIQSLIETIKQLRIGNFSARWKVTKLDELGVMGQTINEAVAELEYRRTERIRLISAIAHDLKNPLSAIGLTCDLFLKKSSDFSKESAITLINKVHSQIGRLKRMIDDLLGAASAVHPDLDLKISSFDLSKLVIEIIDLFKDSHPDRKYIFNPEDNLPEISGDQDRIVQALTNLMSNAIKYSNKSTEIEIAIGKMVNEVFIEVRDRGIGIPEGKLETIFQPFTRLEHGRNMSPGLGLGLATVKGIINAHSGTISAMRREGGGTIFRIELPIKAEGLKDHDDKNSLLAG